MIDVIIISGIAIAAFFVVRRELKRLKRGQCGGCCSGCSGCGSKKEHV